MKAKLVCLLICLAQPCSSDDDSYRAKAEKYVRITGTSAIANSTLLQLESELEQAVNEMYEAFTQDQFMTFEINDDLDLYEAEVKKELKEIFSPERFVELSIPIYMANFSESELDALIEFYESPVGKKVVERLPSILLQSQSLGEKLVMEYLQAIEPHNEKLNKALGLVQ
ncbi:MAG: DUF2059 domain-containing protein [Pseudomonadota bacterium]